MKTVSESIKSHLPLRVIIRPTDAGQFVGLTEESFSMGWEPDRVRIWWSGNAYSNFGSHHVIDGVKDAEYNARSPNATIYDPLSEDCPIDVDLEQWAQDFTAGRSKYLARNAPFKAKERVA